MAFPRIARITGINRWLDIVVEASKHVIFFSAESWSLAANLGLIAAAKTDKQGAEKWYCELLARKGEIGGYLGHALGLIARAAGRLEDGLSHFEKGHVFTRDAGYRPNRAWICRDWAEALLARGDDANRARAKLLLDEAGGIAEKLGMRPLQSSIYALREAFVHEIGPSYPDGLTKREVEVLVLVSKGKSNQEIGYELSISTKTVASHLHRIFDKIGVANRAEAAAYAIRNNLV